MKECVSLTQCLSQTSVFHPLDAVDCTGKHGRPVHPFCFDATHISTWTHQQHTHLAQLMPEKREQVPFITLVSGGEGDEEQGPILITSE